MLCLVGAISPYVWHRISPVHSLRESVNMAASWRPQPVHVRHLRQRFQTVALLCFLVQYPIQEITLPPKISKFDASFFPPLIMLHLRSTWTFLFFTLAAHLTDAVSFAPAPTQADQQTPVLRFESLPTITGGALRNQAKARQVGEQNPICGWINGNGGLQPLSRSVLRHHHNSVLFAILRKSFSEYAINGC